MRRSREPIIWALFGGGGMASALLLPVLILVLFIAVPLGWVQDVGGQGVGSVPR